MEWELGDPDSKPDWNRSVALLGMFTGYVVLDNLPNLSGHSAFLRVRWELSEIIFAKHLGHTRH